MTSPGFWRAICEALVWASPETPALQGADEAVEYAAAFLESQVAALPLHLRAGEEVGLAGFRLHVWLRYMRAFSRLDLTTRVAAVESWASGPVTPCRHLFRALRDLTLLAYHEALTRRTAPVPPPRRVRAGAADATGAVRWHPSIRVAERAEVLVIGSGAGGAVTAFELASRGHDVLVLEEGQAPGPEPSDAGATRTMARLYRHQGMTPILGRVPIAYVEGRCVGGSTEINSGFWHRPPPETLLRWKSRYDLAAASPDELRAHWEWAERILDVGLERRPLPSSSRAFRRGAENLGWAVHEVPRTAAAARAVSACCAAKQAVPRPGLSRSLIPLALAEGARLSTGCRVKRLVVEGDRITGAIASRHRDDGTIERVHLTAEHVFVCAGPTETPALLRRSGITRNVGDALRIHPMLKVAARFRDPIAARSEVMPLLQSTEFGPEIVMGGSYFSPGHLAVVLADNWSVTRDRMRDIDRMACYYVGVRGTGRGTVRPSPLGMTRTDIRYQLSDEDMWNLSRGLSRLSTLLLEGGATEVLPAVHGLPAIRNAVDAVRWLDDRLDGRACSLTTVHAFSSCPMGERLERCAADSFGKVQDFGNLFINDASMIPDSPGVNPQGTIMSLARRNALHFCDAHAA